MQEQYHFQKPMADRYLLLLKKKVKMDCFKI